MRAGFRTPVLACRQQDGGVVKLFSVLTVLCLVFLCCTGCKGDEDSSAAVQSGKSFSGLHFRVVWVQDAGKNKDVFCRGRKLRLMALDSTDNRGERVVVDQVGSFLKPMLNGDARWIVYTSYDQQGHSSVWCVDWLGKGRKRIAAGRAMDIWQEPGTGREWVYFQKNSAVSRREDSGVLYRLPLAGDGREERVWPEQNIPISQDSFQLSADGSMAAGLFPWPRAGTVRLADGRITILERGCWTSLAPDNSFIFWTFRDNHRVVNMVDTKSGKRWEVSLGTSEYIGDHETYHPRWSNNRKYMVLTGPYTVMQGGNAIRGGGEGIEILIGRFNNELTAMNGWLRVTDNQRADFFPDLWIDPKTARDR